ncbi:MAG: hypothetical protein ACP5QO_07450 [Clostridia bacterium]
MFPGSTVHDPRTPDHSREGLVLEASVNPVCLLRTVTILWTDTGTVEELLETDLGPIED